MCLRIVCLSFFTPLPFFLHPYHVLPSPITTTICLPGFYALLPVFPEAPCLCFSPPCLTLFTPLPVFSRLPSCHPLPVFYSSISLYSPSFACLLPPSRLSLYSPLPFFFITPSVSLRPLVCTSCICTSCTHLPVFLSTHPCLF